MDFKPPPTVGRKQRDAWINCDACGHVLLVERDGLHEPGGTVGICTAKNVDAWRAPRSRPRREAGECRRDKKRKLRHGD